MFWFANNIYVEQFRHNENYIVLVFAIYLNIELLYVTYMLQYANVFLNRAQTYYNKQTGYGMISN